MTDGPRDTTVGDPEPTVTKSKIAPSNDTYLKVLMPTPYVKVRITTNDD
jgi:hypothetical protein